MSVDCAVPADYLLGEGPVWDPADRALYWVDIERSRLHRFRPAGGELDEWALAAPPGALAVRSDEGLILALASGFALFDPASGETEHLLDPEPDRTGNRFNDGKTDRRGRFWAGSMDVATRGRTTALYRYDPDGSCVRLLDGLGIPNTLAWSLDDRVMYFAETLDRVICSFDFDEEAGTISGRRIFARVEGGACPDGSTIDADGCLWNAQWNGWRLVRYRPDGAVDRVVEMPVQNPTSCMFGGDDLDVLFVTSARTGLSDEALSRQPLAGCLFALDVGVRGVPETRFGG